MGRKLKGVVYSSFMVLAVLLTSLLIMIGQCSVVAAERRFKGVTLRITMVAEPYALGFRKFAKELYEETGIRLDYDMTPPQLVYPKQMLEFSTRKSSYDIVLFMPTGLADFSKHLEPVEPFYQES